MAARWASLILFTAAAGCADSTEPVRLETHAVSPQVLWAGGEVNVQSTVFGRGEIPQLLAAGDTLDPLRWIERGAVYRLPSTPSQMLPLQLLHEGSVYDLGEVEVVGFRERVEAPALHSQNPVPFPWNHPRWVLGYDAQGSVALLDVSTGRITSYPQIQQLGGYAPGLSVNPGEIVVVINRDSVAVWALGNQPGELDRAMVGHNWRHVWRLGAGAWLSTAHHQSWTQDSTGQRIFYGLESPWAIAFSSRRDRAVMILSASPLGLPVFDPRTADTVYTVEGINGATGAVFSRDGSTLFLQQWGATMRIDATDGTVLNTHTHSTKGGGALVIDPSGNRVYSIGDGGGLIEDRVLTVTVLDAATLGVLGRMESPVTGKCSLVYCVAVLREDTQILYVVQGGSLTTTPGEIITFDLLAESP